jgi:preprotein translocase subunit SecD
MPEKMDRRTEMKQDRLLSQDRDRIRDQDIYGHQLMSAEERSQYRDRLQKAANDREWARIRAEHQRDIQARARAQGVDLEPPIHGQHMMTMEERARFVTRMQEAQGEAEREMIRNEHHEFIRNRARELGMEEPPSAPRQ